MATSTTRRVDPPVPTVRWWVASSASAVLAAGLAAIVPNLTVAIVVGLVAPAVVLGSFVDAKVQRIPNLYNGHSALLVFGAAGAYAVATGHPMAVAAPVGAGVVVLTALLLLTVLSRGQFGLGDVKFGGVLAAALTLVDVTVLPDAALHSELGFLVLCVHLLSWVTLSFLVGGVYAATRLLRGNRAPFAFGPFLAVGWLVAVAAAPAFASLVAPLYS
ncbi:hypothetical protein [Curtobacterium sp. MCBD17_040]|uniref:hypothetical protein n=1 Tax=Curtobacterium sp. MCBD17_040 TaxID=2175674 RepID=UPI0011B55057|nr:hypothetical protein [Curtobacterium sp. MCBD17_040]WIB65627.1 hypothetical protein DEI94_16030 [Curtobacterium sp. MCBD17_040]